MDIAFYKSPLGIIKISSTNNALQKLEIVEQYFDAKCSGFNQKVIESLDLYFQGKLKSFDIPCDFSALTEFQKRVYKALLTVPFGKTISYKDLAQLVGLPNTSRAVGTAMAKNHIPIIIPCHRVVKSNGEFGNYSFGNCENKRFLLNIENNK